MGKPHSGKVAGRKKRTSRHKPLVAPSKGMDTVMLVRMATIILYVIDSLMKTVSDTWPGNPIFDFITSFLEHLLSHINAVQ